MNSKHIPNKWRYTWEAQSQIQTMRLLLFHSLINPKLHCINLTFNLHIEKSLLYVSWFNETEQKLSLRVPVPRVLVDVESPLSFKVMDDHIELKLLLLLPVDHHIISEFDHLGDGGTASGLLVMDSDVELLSSKEGVNFYCRNCSTKLTRNPIREFVEMPSADWQEAADNWFGGCCCSFGGISDKLAAKYAKSYSFAEGTCLLNIMFIVLCKDDFMKCKFPDWDGFQHYDNRTNFVCGDENIKTTPNFGINHVKKICCEDLSWKAHDVDEKCVVEGTGTDNERLLCSLQTLNISGNIPLKTDCCTDLETETNLMAQEHIKSMNLQEHQKSFLNGFLGNLFMVRSSHLSKDVDWVDFECPRCASIIGAYPCKNGHTPVDGGVRLFKYNVSTCLPDGRSEDIFRKYTLERMFTNQLLENAKGEISFRTLVRDMKSKSPALQIILLNPNSWCCSGYCTDTEVSNESASTIELVPC